MSRSSSRPTVSVIVPMLDEAEAIGACLDSILAGDYPGELLEVVVADGGSRDGSAEIVDARAARDDRVRRIPNPKRVAVAAMNAGIAASSGEIVVRADAHTTYAPDYVSACVRLLEATGAAAVGGPQRATGSSWLGRAIALATTSPFGVGDARFRYAERTQDAETVYLGAWRRSTLAAAGGFNEDVPINEDYELNHRLLRAGGRVVLSPEIRSAYRVREGLGALARQYFGYGRAKAQMLRLHPDSIRWRQVAAPLLVAGLTASAALARHRPGLAAALPATYAAATGGASAVAAVRGGWSTLPALPLAFATMHLSWGAGFWLGVLRNGPPRPILRPLLRSVGRPAARP